MSEREHTPEMVELRRLLDEKGVKWEDESDPADQYSKDGRNWVAMQRTHFKVNGEQYGSVIYGRGSKGDGTGLLEAYMPGRSEPVGYLTAQEIIDAWFGEEE